MHLHPKYKLAGLILLLVLVSGCTSIRDQGLVMALQADPSTVFSKSSTLIHIDIDNRNQKTISNVFVDLFDTGYLFDAGILSIESGNLIVSGKCSQTFDRLLPFEFQSMICKLDAPETNATTQTQVNALVSFDSQLDATQVFQVMTEDEYQNRAASGGYEPRPSKYIYQDKNVMIKVDFSEPLPLVVRPGKKYYIYFTITNIGDGFIQVIRPDDLTITPVTNNMPLAVNCQPRQPLAPVGKEFPRIACELDLPSQFWTGGNFLNADFIVSLNYRYEIRNSLNIGIIK